MQKQMSLQTKEVSHPILTFWYGPNSKMSRMLPSNCFDPWLFFPLSLCLFSHDVGVLQSIHQIVHFEKYENTLVPLVPCALRLCAYSILMGACVCLGTGCYQRAYARLHMLIPCSRLVNMFTCISLRSLDRSWSILLPLLLKKRSGD